MKSIKKLQECKQLDMIIQQLALKPSRSMKTLAEISHETVKTHQAELVTEF